MVAIANMSLNEKKEENTDEQNQTSKKITEVYSSKIPKFACVRGLFARNIVEMDFAEDFEVKDYDSDAEIGKRRRKVCAYTGNFNFAPEVEVSVYEGNRFARVYLRYNEGIEKEVLEDIRKILKDSRLVRRLFKQKN